MFKFINHKLLFLFLFDFGILDFGGMFSRREPESSLFGLRGNYLKFVGRDRCFQSFFFF